MLLCTLRRVSLRHSYKSYLWDILVELSILNKIPLEFSFHIANVLQVFSIITSKFIFHFSSLNCSMMSVFLFIFQESLSRGYNMIICIFMPEIIVAERHLPPRINMLRHQVTCIKWPRNQAA